MCQMFCFIFVTDIPIGLQMEIANIQHNHELRGIQAKLCYSERLTAAEKPAIMSRMESAEREWTFTGNLRYRLAPARFFAFAQHFRKRVRIRRVTSREH